MIQSEWPPLDIVLSFVILTPLVVVLFTPLATLLSGLFSPLRLPLFGVTVPGGWGAVALLLAVGAVAVGWRQTGEAVTVWFIASALLSVMIVASGVGVSQPDGSDGPPHLAIDGLAVLPDQFLLLYFVLVLVV
jgi:hypothetical protein